LLEAIAAGVPVVATAVGGVPEVVTCGKHAILVRKHDGTGMASATVEFPKNQRLRNRLVSNAGEVVSQKSPEAYSVFSQVCAHDQ
jgi:glycosyltransferase involved in cell wall biosynthesis